MRLRNLLLVVFLALPFLLGAARPDFNKIGDESVENLSKYLQIDTTNPPGNEMDAVKFLEAICDREGIPATVLDSGKNRGNLYAILKGSNPAKGSLMLLSHSDVVPADAKYWKYPPFSGKIVEGQIWGRGALDMKGMGLVELMAMVAAKRANLPLERDVVLLVVADEEEGADYGIKWMFSQRPDLMKNIAGVVNEEGPGHLEKGKLTFWEVRPGQKGLVWLKLVAKGTPGHGSLPYANSAPNRLIRALYRIQGWETPIQVLPEAKRFFAQLARNETGKRAEQLKDVENGLKDPEFKAWLTSVRHYNAMIRNTISITQLEGSNKTNVIPPVATAMIDCRLLPSEHVDHFIHELKKVINDPEIEIVNTDVYEPVPASTVDTDLFRSICGVIEKYYPGALVVTPYSRAANDSRYFQMRNIIAYGFFPFAVPEEELATMHGNDERISTANVKKGVEMLYDLIVDFAGKK